MRLVWRCLVAFGALQLGTASHAQIYTCTAPDGTRIFSDQRCGPDAKIVPNITTKPRSAASGGGRPKIEPKTAAELDALLEQCNAGDIKACNVWARGGGPNRLRERELAAEKSCAAGSLADCEYRYCAGGVNDECRAKVLATAKITGEDWYMRDTGQTLPDGSVRYQVRCIPAGARIMREVVVTCTGSTEQSRCTSDAQSKPHSRFDFAANDACRSIVR